MGENHNINIEAIILKLSKHCAINNGFLTHTNLKIKR